MLRPVVLLATAALALSGCAPESEQPAAPKPDAGVAQSTEQPTVVGSAPMRSQSVESAAEAPYVQLLAVGDIASCGSSGDEKVARLARERTGRIAILGDSVYPHASAANYRDCFDPAWGPMARRLRPAPGNHEYNASATAKPYFDYFGDWTGDRGKGWYAYNLGNHWRAIVLNSNCARIGGCGTDSPQGRWLAKALVNAGDRHIVAYWHHPLYSSGQHGPNPSVRPMYRALFKARAAIVLNGHDHLYERFAPQNAQGERRSYGIQQFIVGTGGYTHYSFGQVLPNSRVRDNTSFGLLRLRLKSDGYNWRFIASEGGFTDSGRRLLD